MAAVSQEPRRIFLLGGPGVNLLHGLHSAVVLAGEGVEDQVEVLGGE